jgi:hypothetical protein
MLLNIFNWKHNFSCNLNFDIITYKFKFIG